MHEGSSCGQPGEDNSNIAAIKWLMRIPPAAGSDHPIDHQTKLKAVEIEWITHLNTRHQSK
jgi:hypothetical protein